MSTPEDRPSSEQESSGGPPAEQPASAPDNGRSKQENPSDPTPEEGTSATPEEESTVNLSLSLSPGTRLQVTIEALPGNSSGAIEGEGQTLYRQTFVSEGNPVFISVPGTAEQATQPNAAGKPLPATRAIPRSGGIFRGISARVRDQVKTWPYSLAMTLFLLGGLVYLASHFIGLTEFPIYFFTDEAIQTNLASDLVRDNFQGRSGDFLPTYFENGNQFNLSFSVYIQLLPYLLFGKSVFVTRATSVLITLLGALALSLALKEGFKNAYWWSGVLFLSITPAWFLHSRTAFETAEATALFAVFLYLYLLYRYREPKYLYPALVAGALTFYAYSPAQLVIVLTGLLLLISDWRYHWDNRTVGLRGIGLLVLLALPYLRFLIQHPDENLNHLRILHSYWIEPIPLSEKLGHYFAEYRYGLSPGYWFIPNDRDLVRHIMKGYGHLLRASLPFVLIGLGVALKNFRSSAHRLALIALVAAPSGAALVELGVTRALVLVVPAALLTVLGVSAVLRWVEKLGLPRGALAVSLFAVLATANFAMLRDALVNGPTWFDDYGLGGMQYGGRQIFEAIEDFRDQHPADTLILSPSWANGTTEVAQFFLPQSDSVQLGSVEGYMFQQLPLDPHMVLVMIPDEYQQALESGKFTDIQVEKTVPYPDGRPGFYFVRMRYVDNIEEILAAERESRRALLSGTLLLEGQQVTISYPHLDMGEVEAAFDGDPNSLIRTLEANPLVIELDFPEPRSLQSLIARVGGAPTEMIVEIVPAGTQETVQVTRQVNESPTPREVNVDFPTPIQAAQVRISIRNTNEGEPAHVHLWELTLR